jgi:hypothetical protein
MKRFLLVSLIFACLSPPVLAQTQALSRRVSLEYKDVTLEKIILDLKKKYKVNFSYTNNLIPLHKKVSIKADNQSLETILTDLFREVNVSFQVIGDQVVLKNEPKQKNPQSVDRRTNYPSFGQIRSIRPVTASTKPVYEVEVPVEEVPVTDTTNRKKETPITNDALNNALRKLRNFPQRFSDAVVSSTQTIMQEIPVLSPSPKPGVDKPEAGPKQPFDGLRKKKKDSNLSPAGTTSDTDSTRRKIEQKEDTSGNTVNEQVEEKEKLRQPASDSTQTDSSGYIKRPVQLTFIPPLGTNGLQAGKIVNHISFNVLAGYAAGVAGVEFASLANVEKDFVKGAQFAGLVNVVKKEVTGGQFAGIANLNGGETKGFQAAGFMNVANDSVQAVQAAGFLNLANGPVRGAQAAGFMNLVYGSVTGLQAAGFMNMTSSHVKGAQVAGFLNIAKKVKGVQISIINVADSVDGVQIGLLNFSRHGYRRFEFWGSESMYANAAFKMGTQYFHNIFAIGFRTPNDRYSWAYGYGFGSEISLSSRMVLNLDAIAWNVSENGSFTRDLNLLNQLRLNVGVRLFGRATLFAGPTINVFVSDHNTADGSTTPDKLAPWHTYKDDGDDVHVILWPGLNAGFRF